MKPDFDDLVGSDVDDAERLRKVHELLVIAGPPPELTPRLDRTPDVEGGVGNVFTLPNVPIKRRTTLLIAAAVAMLAIFAGGYALGHARSTTAERPLSILPLHGTKSDPRASASLAIFGLQSGNWPMELTVSNLPKLPANAYYDVYLVRNGKPYLSCGEFTVAGSGSGPLTVKLNAPYVFHKGDTWVVTKQLAGHETPGPEILRPAV